MGIKSFGGLVSLNRKFKIRQVLAEPFTNTEIKIS